MLTPRRLAAAAAGLVALGSLVQAPAATGAAVTQAVRTCQSLSALQLPNTVVNSATAVAATSTVPAYCAVQLTVNNPPSDDAVRVGVFMPTSSWNGRFEGVGGGGYSTGSPTVACSPFQQPCPLQQGYASAATDGGHTVFDGSFALNPDGTLNWQLIDDFSFLGIHEMTMTAKSVIGAFYGTGARFSYFNGCSTGGRQGLMEAQRYPTDYNGIASGAPAINWTKFIPAELWGELQMNLAHDFIPQCKLAAAGAAAIAACDGLDGVSDGIISDWQDCHFDARTLVGTATPCGTVQLQRSGQHRHHRRRNHRSRGVPDLRPVVPGLAGAEAQPRLADDHVRPVPGLLPAVGLGVRLPDRHRRSEPDRLPRRGRQDRHLARDVRPADLPAGNGELLWPRRPDDGWPRSDGAVRAAVRGARSPALHERRGAGPGRPAGRRRQLGRAPPGPGRAVGHEAGRGRQRRDDPTDLRLPARGPLRGPRQRRRRIQLRLQQDLRSRPRTRLR
ncbi:MAG: tannase/feruloyl esterase family alpha/beta hydrolase [Chloroflexi bacterium]|nr:MAG: tannase/feruloyl esterase family alpha/beta hydrolase [Chloroflexota bacterium]